MARPGRKPDGDTSPEAIFLHCQKVYKIMTEEAELKTDDLEQEILVWEGMFTALITQQANLSIPYYSKITKALKEMGCIRQLKRGGGTSPSQWELIKAPTLDLYENRITHSRVPRATQFAQLQGRVNSLEKRVAILEGALQRFIDGEEGEEDE